MSWHYLQDQGAAFWEGSCLDGAPAVLSRLIPTAGKFCCKGRPTGCSTAFRSGTTSAPSTADRGTELSISLPADFPAKTFPQPVRGPESRERVLDYGKKWPELSVKFNPLTSWWRTHRCLFPEDLTSCSLTLPRWGSMRNGELSGRAMPEHLTRGKESGFWATPVASDGNRGGVITLNMSGQSLPQMINTPTYWPTPCLAGNGGKNGKKKLKKMLHGGNTTQRISPTPTAQDAKNNGAQSQQERNTRPLNAEIGGALNPDWVEWLMGWPIGWTDLKPLATDKCSNAQRRHGGF